MDRKNELPPGSAAPCSHLRAVAGCAAATVGALWASMSSVSGLEVSAALQLLQGATALIAVFGAVLAGLNSRVQESTREFYLPVACMFGTAAVLRGWEAFISVVWIPFLIAPALLSLWSLQKKVRLPRWWADSLSLTLVCGLNAVFLAEVSVLLAGSGVVEGNPVFAYAWAIAAYTLLLSGLVARLTSGLSDLSSRNDELTQRVTELAGANEGLEAFVRSASHDLKAPLRHIATFCGFVQSDAADRLTEQEKQDLIRVAESAIHMSDLLESLLRFAKLGATSLQREAFPLSEVVETIVSQLPPDQQAKVVYSELASVVADRALMTIVLQNLIENGLKYKREVESRVIVQSETTPAEVIVRVTDNGTGMERNQWDRIFEPGVRGVEQSKVPGTGYGLASCMRIIHAHDGSIWVDSEVGKGSTFHFTIPNHDAPG